MALKFSDIDVEPVIARRTLYVIGQQHKQISVLIGKPRYDQTLKDFICPFSINGVQQNPFKHAGVGVDELQALISAISSVGSLLENFNREKLNGKLRWLSDDEPLDENFGVPIIFGKKS